MTSTTDSTGTKWAESHVRRVSFIESGGRSDGAQSGTSRCSARITFSLLSLLCSAQNTAPQYSTFLTVHLSKVLPPLHKNKEKHDGGGGGSFRQIEICPSRGGSMRKDSIHKHYPTCVCVCSRTVRTTRAYCQSLTSQRIATDRRVLRSAEEQQSTLTLKQLHLH